MSLKQVFAVKDNSDACRYTHSGLDVVWQGLLCFFFFSLRSIIKKSRDLFTILREAARQSRCNCRRTAKCLVSHCHACTRLQSLFCLFPPKINSLLCLFLDFSLVGLLQRFLVLQVDIPHGKDFSVELV